MANTFGGVAFYQEQQQGTSVVVWPDEYVTAVEHIPGSDTDIVQHLGKRGLTEVALAIIVTSANWAAFLGQRGQTSTLALIGNATRQATLTKLDNVRWFEQTGIYKLTATWLG